MKRSNVLSALLLMCTLSSICISVESFLVQCVHTFASHKHTLARVETLHTACVSCILTAGGFLSELLSTGQLIMMAYLWMCNGMIY